MFGEYTALVNVIIRALGVVGIFGLLLHICYKAHTSSRASMYIFYIVCGSTFAIYIIGKFSKIAMLFCGILATITIPILFIIIRKKFR